MNQPILERVLSTLRTRHSELVRWLGQSKKSEVSLRLGDSTTPRAIEEEVQELAAAIEKAERSELGRCTVCHESVEDHLLAMDYTARVCLEHLDREQRRRLESELELSQKVQRALLPQAPPSIPGWQIAAFSQPASVVGGDYFDFLQFGGGTHAFIIADVMGKGMPASMLMANMQASLRIIIPESNDPKEVVERLNRIFHHNISLTKFVSLFLCQLDPSTGIMQYVNAGHHPPYILSGKQGNNAGFRSLRPTGPAIGLVENPEFTVGEATMERGDVLALYTDGIVETRSPQGEEFGDHRLQSLLRDSILKPVQEITQSVRSQLHAFAGRPVPDDDATLIIGRRAAS